MKLKIKAKPEDFVVEEIADLPLSKEGRFGVYLLTKSNWNTVDLLWELSKKLRIPFHCFSYGGKKDRYGLTRQYITIEGRKDLVFREKNYCLEFIGSISRPMVPALIKGNGFEVTVRKLEEPDIAGALIQLEAIKAQGFANYFDDQRLGSFDKEQGFFAEKILKGQYNGALKIYLTSVHPADNKEKKERRRFFYAHWRDWDVCLEKVKTNFERKAVAFLSKNPNKFLYPLKQVPHEELTVYFSCYQSYLWNEMLRRLLTNRINYSSRKYPGLAGEYVFYDRIKEEDLRYLENLNIPAPGAKPTMPDNFVKDLYERVLEDNGIKNSMFNKLKLRKAFFKSFQRNAIIKPQDINVQVLDDELYRGKKKLFLKFVLFRGSYATMLVKRIFSQE